MQWCLPPEDEHFKDPNTYQQDAYDLLIKHTKNKRTALDVGAHIGIFTRRFAQDFEHVVAVEPVNHTYLQANTRDLDNVHIFPIGAGDKTRTLYAHNPKSSNTGAWELSESVSDCAVSVVAIDSLWIPQLDCVKIDAQGMERDILTGAEHTLRKYKPTLLVELPCAKTVEFLADLDYKLIEKCRKDCVFVAD